MLLQQPSLLLFFFSHLLGGTEESELDVNVAERGGVPRIPPGRRRRPVDRSGGRPRRPRPGTKCPAPTKEAPAGARSEEGAVPERAAGRHRRPGRGGLGP